MRASALGPGIDAVRVATLDADTNGADVADAEYPCAGSQARSANEIASSAVGIFAAPPTCDITAATAATHAELGSDGAHKARLLNGGPTSR